LPQASDYKPYSVAMANSGPNTNGSQFFVVLSEDGAKGLTAAVGGEAKYSLFGTVTEGMDVVDTIGKVEVSGDTPSTLVTMTSVTITES
ncbi:MAG: peptidylprolyl isomerase, partial [Microthrixaceae bacterium]|nr:peptidylprolyl isomerase [Microthrixaceae bacterium]